MNAALATLLALGVYAAGYFFYSRFLAERLYGLADRPTPAHRLRDDTDYVPTGRWVLFGHHWASITGLAPMLGPAIAVVWGWLPALLWVVLGAVLIGCVHDFSALVLSLRARGVSVGKLAEGIIGPRAKALFLAIIFFGISLAMGVFVLAIAGLFAKQHAAAVVPSGGLMVTAAAIGVLLRRRPKLFGPAIAVGFLVQLGLIGLGLWLPEPRAEGETWSLLLLVYAFLASVLPVWTLLQPRDFLNSLLLYLGLLLAFVGFFLITPEFSAPAVRPDPEGAPPMMPFVFITIACGAASGFHALVASGTTSKQLDRERDARPIGYGGMLGESLLGVLAVLATTVGFTLHPASPLHTTPQAVWHQHYATWQTAARPAAAPPAKAGPRPGEPAEEVARPEASSAPAPSPPSARVRSPLERFIDGTAVFIARLGLRYDLARALIAVMVVSFALTTLDSATRLLRYNVAEIGQSLRAPWLAERHLATLVAVLGIGFFAFYRVDGLPAGKLLWQLFGTTNQLLASLTLLVATLYLRARGRNPWWTGLPCVFMLGNTLLAMLANLRLFSARWTFEAGTRWPLFLVGAALLALGVGVVFEGGLAYRRLRGRAPIEDLEIALTPDRKRE